MKLNLDVNDEYADFVLTYAKSGGLERLVRNLEMENDNTNLKADLQADLIQAFSKKFPDADLKDLDKTVEWVLLASVAKRVESKTS